MRWVVVWWRIGSSRWAALGGLLAGVYALTARAGWFWDHASAATWSVTSTVLVGPIVAGLVAHDTWRAATPTMRTLAPQTRRGGIARLVPAAAVATTGLAVLALLVGGAHGYAAFLGASGSGQPIVYVQGAAAILASAGLGLVVGRLAPGFLAGPLAASLGYMLPILLKALGTTEVLVLRGVKTPASFLDVPLDAAVAQIGAALGVLLLGCALVALAGAGAFRRGAAVAVCGAVIAVGLVAGARAGDELELREVSTATCAGTVLTVCGPPEAGRVLDVAREGLEDAVRTLADDGFDVGRVTLTLEPGDTTAVGRGALVIPADLGSGGLTPEQVATNLVPPVTCAQMVAEAAPMEMLAVARSVGAWMMDRLGSDDPGSPADLAGAQASYDALARCETPPPFDYVPEDQRRVTQ